MRWLGTGTVVGVVAGLLTAGLAIAPADAAPTTGAVRTAPAATPAPKAPKVLYTEDFENTTDPVLLTDYTGASGMKYTAADDWLQYCSGWVMKAGDPEPAAAQGECQDYAGGGAWGKLLSSLSDTIGSLHGDAPGTNHAVSASTDPFAGTPHGSRLPNGADQIEFATADSSIKVDSGRYLTFSVDAAATTCSGESNAVGLSQATDPQYKFYLTGGATPVPVFNSPIRPCVTPPGGTYDTALGDGGTHAGTYYSDGSILFDGTNLGVQLVNGSGSRYGNDAAFDNIRVVDVTPTLYKEFSDPDTNKTSTLTFHVVNTSELSSKSGWSFNDTIDPNLAIDTSSAATTCTNGTVNFSGQTMSVTGDLATGQASCDITVKVTAKTVGTFQNCPGTNVTDIVGLDGPECATLAVGDYTIAKSSSPTTGSTVAEGDKITYTLTAKATANSPAEAVIPIDVTDSMADVLKEATYNGDASASTGSIAVQPNGDLHWTGSIAGNGTATATFSVTVKPYAQGADHKADNFVVKTGDVPPAVCAAGDPQCTEHPVAPPASVTISKDDHKTVVSAGESTTYDIVVKNTSTANQPATGVVVTDVLPAELEYDSSSDQGSYDPATRTVTWNVGTLAAGASKTVHVTAKVAASVAPDTDITNVAKVTTDKGCTTPGGCETTDVDQTPPAVSILKDDHKTIVKPGEELTYDITASNMSSKQAANGVVITDVLPAELTYKSASNGGSYDSSTRTVTWNLGTLAPSEAKTVQLTVVVDKSTKPDTSIANTATVTTDKGCLNPAGCDSTDTDKTPASVSIVKDDHKVTVKPGEDTTYDLVVANASKDQDATGVIVTDTLPAQLDYKGSTDGGSYDPATRTVTWNLGTLKAGASKTIQITATVNASTGPDATITNTAKVDTDQGCVVDADCNTTDVDRTPPAVSIVKDDHKTILKPGESTTYDLTVTNKSPDQIAKAVVVTDTLPDGLVFASASDDGAYDPDTHTVTWKLGDLVAGGERVLQVTGVLDDTTPTDTDVTNTATVDTEDGCLVKADCETTDTDTTPPAVSVVKDDHKTVVGLGEKLTYDLVVTNKSVKQDATGVVVTDTLPAELAYVSASDDADYSAGVVTWNLGTLAKGESRTVTVTVTVRQETPAGADITNAATVETDQGCVIAADCTTTDTDHTPDVSILKDDHTTVVYPGQSLTYDVTVTNNADWAATGVTAVDTLPSTLTFVSATDSGRYDQATRTVIWNLGELAGHQVRVVQVTVTVAKDVTASQDIVNLASVTTDQGCVGDGCSTQDKDLLDPPAAILAETGSTISAIGIWIAIGAVLIGGGLLLARRLRRKPSGE